MATRSAACTPHIFGFLRKGGALAFRLCHTCTNSSELSTVITAVRHQEGDVLECQAGSVPTGLALGAGTAKSRCASRRRKDLHARSPRLLNAIALYCEPPLQDQ